VKSLMYHFAVAALYVQNVSA